MVFKGVPPATAKVGPWKYNLKGNLKVYIEAWHPFKKQVPADRLADRSLKFQRETVDKSSTSASADVCPENRAKSRRVDSDTVMICGDEIDPRVLAELGLEKVTNAGSGDCLYHALAQATGQA